MVFGFQNTWAITQPTWSSCLFIELFKSWKLENGFTAWFLCLVPSMFALSRRSGWAIQFNNVRSVLSIHILLLWTPGVGTPSFLIVYACVLQNWPHLFCFEMFLFRQAKRSLLCECTYVCLIVFKSSCGRMAVYVSKVLMLWKFRMTIICFWLLSLIVENFHKFPWGLSFLTMCVIYVCEM